MCIWEKKRLILKSYCSICVFERLGEWKLYFSFSRVESYLRTRNGHSRVTIFPVRCCSIFERQRESVSWSNISCETDLWRNDLETLRKFPKCLKILEIPKAYFEMFTWFVYLRVKNAYPVCVKTPSRIFFIPNTWTHWMSSNLTSWYLSTHLCVINRKSLCHNYPAKNIFQWARECFFLAEPLHAAWRFSEKLK